ncbi:MAG TPA: diacylglycerol kinase family protein [Telluria sp.]|nr:diacylglycerol kinase family protein [Telluria sp.]
MADDLHAPGRLAASAARRRLTVILNGGAGTGHDGAAAEQVRGLFAQAGARAELVLARDGDDLARHARQALAGGADAVVAGGGDGTLNAVAAVLAGTGVPFGILPLGTLNHFAKDLGIPLVLEDAVRTVLQGQLRRVDVGEVNGRIFLNNSSLGLYPDMVRERERQQRRLGRGKWTAALWASLAALRRYPFLSVRLKVEDAEHARRTPFVFIGNNAYLMQGLSIGARARLDEGKLSVYVAQHPTRLSLLRFALRALCGKLAQARDFDVLLVENMDIHTRHRRLRVATDGELAVLATPLAYRIRPGALAVIVP